VLGNLKDWTIQLVIQDNEFTRHAYWALWGLAFAESSFFPIPPDIPFIFMGIAKPPAAFFLATIMTIGSVLGGAMGYAIGFYGGRPLVNWMVENRWVQKVFSRRQFEMVESQYNRYDVWAVLIAAFTPIPYKVFTIGGGLCRISFWRFMAASTLGRAGRFFLVATLLYWFGASAQFILRNFDIFLIVMLILVVLGFAVLRYLHKPSPGTDVS